MIRSILYQFIRAIRAVKRIALDWITTLYYRTVCAEFGSGSSIAWGVWIANPAQVSIGRKVRIARGTTIGTEALSAHLKIGDGVQMNRDVVIDYSGGVII